jgi:hypothetical protein
MHLVSGSDEEKVVLVATAKCLCDYPPLQQAKELWTALKDEAFKTAQGEQLVPFMLHAAKLILAFGETYQF